MITDNALCKRWLNGAGTLFAIGGLAFVTFRLWGYRDQVELALVGIETWLTLGGLSLVYGGAGLLLAWAWLEILRSFHMEMPFSWGVKTYGTTQLAKYIPGNIFHFASRQAKGMVLDVPGFLLAKSIMWELILLSSAGTMFVFPILSLLFPVISVPLSIFLFVVCTIFLILGIYRFVNPLMAKTFLLYIIFLVVSGIIFVVLISSICGTLEMNILPQIVGAYVVAWLVGMVTPGAPAGAGVREIILLFLLNGYFASSDLLLAVVLGRAITVIGDILFFLYASALQSSPTVNRYV